MIDLAIFKGIGLNGALDKCAARLLINACGDNI